LPGGPRNIEIEFHYIPDEADEAAEATDIEGETAYKYIEDSRGRRYPANRFGSRIRQSRKPDYIDSYDWKNKMSKQERKEVLLFENKEAKRKFESTGSGASPATPAELVAWDDNYSQQWDHVDNIVDDFNNTWGLRQCCLE
jgi:hypothetical protein